MREKEMGSNKKFFIACIIALVIYSLISFIFNSIELSIVNNLDNLESLLGRLNVCFLIIVLFLFELGLTFICSVLVLDWIFSKTERELEIKEATKKINKKYEMIKLNKELNKLK